MNAKLKAFDADELMRRIKLLEAKVITLNERVNGLRQDWNRQLMRDAKEQLAKPSRDDAE